MTFLVSLICFSILKSAAWLFGVLSGVCEYASWAFDWLDHACFHLQWRLDRHADRYIVRESATIRPNKRRA